MTEPLADRRRDRAESDPSAPKPGSAERESASVALRGIVDRATGETMTLGEIVSGLGDRAFGFAMILFSLPNCVPMPPGVAGIVGMPVLIFGLQMMFGQHKPWLPGFVMRRHVSVASFRKLIDVAEPRLQKLEAFCRPRLTGLFGPLGDRLIGLFAVLVAVSVLIPFPGTNFPPSLALVIVSIAVMEEDGILLLIGFAIGLAGFAYTAAVTGAAFELTKLFFASVLGL